MNWRLWRNAMPTNASSLTTAPIAAKWIVSASVKIFTFISKRVKAPLRVGLAPSPIGTTRSSFSVVAALSPSDSARPSDITRPWPGPTLTRWDAASPSIRRVNGSPSCTRAITGPVAIISAVKCTPKVPLVQSVLRELPVLRNSPDCAPEAEVETSSVTPSTITRL